MKKLIYTFAALLIISTSYLYSQDKELVSKREELRAELETLEREYWNNKTDEFKVKENYKLQIDNLDDRIKSLYSKKNILLDELYLLKDNETSKEEEYNALNDRFSSFRLQIVETVNKDAERVKFLYPNIVTDASLRLSKISELLEQDNITKAISEYFDYKTYLIKEGERATIETSTMVSIDKTPTEAQKLRLGYIGYYASYDNEVRFVLRRSSLRGVFYEWNETLLSGGEGRFMRNAIDEAFMSYGKEGYIEPSIDVSQSGEKTKEIIGSSSNSFISGVIDFFRKGGIVMFPLVAIAIFAIIISVERIIFFTLNHRKVDTLFDDILPLLMDGKIEEAKVKASKIKSPIVNISIPIFENNNVDKENTEYLVEEILSKEGPLFEKRLSTLKVLGAIAPLLGLLGTVTGMISLFQVITLAGTGDPKLLADGISEALVTTQTGLSIAIPIIFIHHFLSRKRDKIFEDVQVSISTILNHIVSKSS